MMLGFPGYPEPFFWGQNYYSLRSIDHFEDIMREQEVKSAYISSGGGIGGGHGNFVLNKHRQNESSPSTSILMEVSFEKLPYDVVVNIYSRLPARFLWRCRSVCKSWRSMIECPELAELLLATPAAQETELVSLFLVGGCSPPKIALFAVREDDTFPPNTRNGIFSEHPYSSDIFFMKDTEHPISEVAYGEDIMYPELCCYTYGVIVFSSLNKVRKDEISAAGETFLFNPLRGEALMLPQLTTTVVKKSPHPHEATHLFECYGFGFSGYNSSSRRNNIPYKVIRVFSTDARRFWGPTRFVAEVFILGTASWRRIPSLPPFLRDPSSEYLKEEGVGAYGHVHWLFDKRAVPAVKGYTQGMIASFDFDKEEFKVTPHPDFGDRSSDTLHLLRLFNVRGFLAMADLSSPSKVDIWVLKDYDRKYWVKDYSFSSQPLDRKIVLHDILFGKGWNPKICTQVYFWNDGFLFRTSCEGFLYYNPEADDDYVKHLRFDEKYYLDPIFQWGKMFAFAASLVSLNDYDGCSVEMTWNLQSLFYGS